MFKPGEMEEIPLKLEKQFKDLENRIMLDIIRRLKANGSEITRSADWQINKLYELGKSKEEIKQFIKETLNLSDSEINRIFGDVISSGYARNENLYNSLGQQFIPFAENYQLQSLIDTVAKQTYNELNNITQSLGFAVKQPDNKLKFTPLAEYYQKTLDSAVLDITSGAFDYNTVLKRVVTEMTNSGLRTVDYASGWSNRIDVAARRAIMTGVTQITGKITEQTAKDLETDTFEVSFHFGARPEHAEWQGGIYSKDDLINICGLGEVTGLLGANCYHNYWAFIPGISVPTYTEEQLREMKEKDNIPKDYYGKQYTAYEALQKQRRLETAMRAQRQKISLLQEGGADEDDIITAKAKYHGISQEYARFSKAMDLPQQRERIYGDSLGNISKGKWTLTNAKGKRIIKVNRNSLTGIPNSITHKVNANGGIDRNYYGEDGKQIKQITNNNHGNPKKHPYGHNGEHAHDYNYDERGKLLSRPMRELTDYEREENADIL